MCPDEFLRGAAWLRDLSGTADQATKPDLLFLAAEFEAAAKRILSGGPPQRVTITFPK